MYEKTKSEFNPLKTKNEDDKLPQNDIPLNRDNTRPKQRKFLPMYTYI